MIDSIITKIKETVEGLASPSYSFLFEGWEKANIELENTSFEKIAILLDWQTAKITKQGNGLKSEIPDLKLCFCKRVVLGETATNMRDDCVELEADVLAFIRACEVDNEIGNFTIVDVQKLTSKSDENLLVYQLTFDMFLLAGTSLLSCE